MVLLTEADIKKLGACQNLNYLVRENSNVKQVHSILEFTTDSSGTLRFSEPTPFVFFVSHHPNPRKASQAYANSTYS